MKKSMNDDHQLIETGQADLADEAPRYRESRRVYLDPATLEENRCLVTNAPEIASYKIIRTQIIKKTRASGRNVIMITSPNPGEGKTLTAINLSITFAREFNQTVLLMDCDLIRQNVHKYLGFESQTGLADYLKGRSELKDLIVWPGIEKFTLISGGETLQDSTEYLSSPRMAGLVSEVKQRYANRYVFFDVPPVLSGADAMTFAQVVDGIVLVVESGRTSSGDIEKTLELLPREKILGIVINKDDSHAEGYYY